MRHVFIDLGAYDGDTVQKFMTKSYRLPVPPEEFLVYAVEPNSDLFDALAKTVKDYPNIQVIKKAAWINDGKIEFAIDKTKDSPMGSTLMPGKKNIWDHFGHYSIECFDFPQWLKQFKDDFVIVKCDIEGAEFPIFSKMIIDGSVKLIDELWMEWHHGKVIEYSTEHKDKLQKAILDSGVQFEEWG